jgi:hypothetical protein
MVKVKKPTDDLGISRGHLFIKRKPYARRMVQESFQRCMKKAPLSVKINFGSPPNLSN